MSHSLFVIDFPSKVISPEVGFSKRFKHLKNVLFPEPDGPISTKTSPFLICSSIPFKT